MVLCRLHGWAAVSDTTSSECTQFERIDVLRLSDHIRIPCPVDCGWRVIEQSGGTFLVMEGRWLLAGQYFLRCVMFLSLVEM